MSRTFLALGLVTASQIDAAKVLMVLTSHGTLGEEDGEPTGWYLPEAAHPFAVFDEAGVEMTWASPQGGKAPVDPGSVETYTKGEQADDDCIDFMKKEVWEKTEKLSDVTDKDFDAVFVVGGYGVMWDLVGNGDLEKVVASIYDKGGVASAVCHGPAALVGVKLSDGSSLVKDKEVTCFSNAEEDQLELREVVPKTCEDAYGEAGAKFTNGEPWTDHVIVSGRLITGENPQSARSTAEEVVKALDVDTEDKDEAETEEKADLTFSLAVPGTSSMAVNVACCALVGAILTLSVRIYRNRQQSFVDSDASNLLSDEAVE